MASSMVDQDLYSSDPPFDDEDAPFSHPPTIAHQFIDPQPYLSSQFYTFNYPSHHLMVQCILAGRHALPHEIKAASPPSVLASWRSVWKDRHEDTAFLTGWKRIQEKLQARVDDRGDELLFFRNNPQQLVPHVDQWQSIMQSVHGDADFKHLGVKDTVDKIKQRWTVGEKFYGIPESFIRFCVASCRVCNSDRDSLGGAHGKRRRFEYSETIEVIARDVPQRLQQLAAKHKVILCIRQKYIRFKPFLAEVKDYCCHRAGEPTNKRKLGSRKGNNRLNSERCGCGFRIRAIVPITHYSDKDKTFSYLEEGMAVFKLFPVHSGHDPGAQEGGIVINRVLDSSLVMELGNVVDSKSTEESHEALLRHLQDLGAELGALEGRIGSIPVDVLNTISQELLNVSMKLKNVEYPGRMSMMLRPDELDVKDCDPEGVRDEDGSLEGMDGSLVGIHENFYHGNDKWYEGVSCTLDPSTDCTMDMSHSVQSDYRPSIT